MLISQIQDLVCEHYVFPDVADQVSSAIADVPVNGTSDADLAAVLTSVLQSVNGDGHLRVRHYPEGVPPEREGDGLRGYLDATVAKQGAGVTGVVRLDGNAGVLTLGPVLMPAEYAAPHLTAAFTLIRTVETVLIDLRECIGGSPETVALVVSHLSGSEPIHLQDIVDRDRNASQSWTVTSAAPKLPATVPAWVLTSRQTFSGGEELAYDLQALGRAQVVGETTGGGAHPRVGFTLSPTLQLHVPTARSVNTITGTNWEGVGVKPDIECAADEALHRALAATQST